MGVNNPDCSLVGIYGEHTAPTPAGLAEIVGDDFPVPHSIASIFMIG
jgi:hypothetical protein